MITDALIGLLVTLLTGLIGMIPAIAMPNLGVGSTLGSAVAGANSVFPVSTLGLCIAAVVTFRTGLFFADFAVWLWKKLPFTFK